MNKTSSQAYEEYRKLSQAESMRNRMKYGISLFEGYSNKLKYFLSINLVVTENLFKREEKLVVNTNLPLSLGWYEIERGMTPKKILEKIEIVCSRPLCDINPLNNRKEGNTSRINGYSSNFRDFDFSYEDIDIKISELAKGHFDLEEYKQKLKYVIDSRRFLTNDERVLVRRYHLLSERIFDLKRMNGEKSSGSYYYSSYGKPKDSTETIKISAEEYNTKLQEVENELKEIVEKIDFVELPRFDFIEIPTEKDIEERYTQFVDGILDELTESWENLEDEDKAEYESDFENYCRDMFDNQE